MSISIGDVYTFTNQAYIDSYLLREPELDADKGRAIFTSGSDADTKHQFLITNNYYYNEINDEVIAINTGSKYMILIYKTFSNMKLINNFVFRSYNDGSIDKIQCISRCNAKIVDLPTALESVGLQPDRTKLTENNIHNTSSNSLANEALQQLYISINKL
jgi:hypothetical protein